MLKFSPPAISLIWIELECAHTQWRILWSDNIQIWIWLLRETSCHHLIHSRCGTNGIIFCCYQTADVWKKNGIKWKHNFSVKICKLRPCLLNYSSVLVLFFFYWKKWIKSSFYLHRKYALLKEHTCSTIFASSLRLMPNKHHLYEARSNESHSFNCQMDSSSLVRQSNNLDD